MIGDKVLGYRIDEKIGAGGFGTVYKVSKANVAGTQIRALKHITLPTRKQYSAVLNSMGGDYSKADDYFAAILKDITGEINVLSMLSESGNKNIVRYYENDITETQSPKTYDIFILMELLTPLTEYVEENSVTVRDIIKIGKDILKALEICHGKGIIHRDIKDDNIFVSADGTFKLGDFGVSKLLRDKSGAESVKGTPNFIAPEVYLGKEKYDCTVDIYSLGIVLYRLLNKSRGPFLPRYPETYNTDDEDKAFELRMSGEVPPLPIYAENKLGKAVLRAIMRKSERYSTAREFYDALVKAENELGEEELAEDMGLCLAQCNKKTGEDKGLSNTFDNSLHNNETVGSDELNILNISDETESNRHLFDTIGVDDTKASSVDVSNNTQSISDVFASDTWGSASSSVSPSLPDEPKQKRTEKPKWLVVLPSVLIALIWLVVRIVYWANYPSSSYWFYGFSSFVMKIFDKVCLAGLSVSLFFVGWTIQNKKPEKNKNAKLNGKEAYIITTRILENIKLIDGVEAKKARKAVALLSEKLKNESDFGVGNDSVVDCENKIFTYLQMIEDVVPNLADENSREETAQKIEQLTKQCRSQLKIRAELNKR